MFRSLLGDLRQVAAVRSAWVFVCAAGFVEYLTRLVSGRITSGSDYTQFVATWLRPVDARYVDFRHHSGHQDLPRQMYHVFRGGIVHGLSLIPDSKSRKEGGRDRSIALCHREEAAQRGLRHLDPFSGPHFLDAALFVAEDFVTHLEQVVDAIFTTAQTDVALCRKIEQWTTTCPIVRAGF